MGINLGGAVPLPAIGTIVSGGRERATKMASAAVAAAVSCFVVSSYYPARCGLANDSAVCKRGYNVFHTEEECCAMSFRGGDGEPSRGCAPELIECWVPDSYYNPRSCGRRDGALGTIDDVCDRGYDVWSSEEECCRNSFVEGCDNVYRASTDDQVGAPKITPGARAYAAARAATAELSGPVDKNQPSSEVEALEEKQSIITAVTGHEVQPTAELKSVDSEMTRPKWRPHRGKYFAKQREAPLAPVHASDSTLPQHDKHPAAVNLFMRPSLVVVDEEQPTAEAAADQADTTNEKTLNDFLRGIQTRGARNHKRRKLLILAGFLVTAVACGSIAGALFWRHLRGRYIRRRFPERGIIAHSVTKSVECAEYASSGSGAAVGYPAAGSTSFPTLQAVQTPKHAVYTPLNDGHHQPQLQ